MHTCVLIHRNYCLGFFLIFLILKVTYINLSQSHTKYITHLPGSTAKVRLHFSDPISFFDIQTKNPDVSLEILKRDNTPSSAK